MSQIFKPGTGGSATSVNTISAENGTQYSPSSNNFNFSGTVAGGYGSNGAIVFSASTGEVNGQVQVDGTTVAINGSNQLTALTGFAWEFTTSTSFTPAANTGYILGGGSQATITLPTSGSISQGFIFAVVDQSGHTYIIAQNPGDIIQVGDQSTTLSTGNITSQNVGDSLSIVCWANSPGGSWIALQPLGNFEIN